MRIPRVDGGGEVKAVVVLALSLDRLSECLPLSPAATGATMSLVDGDGVLLARAPPAPDLIGQRVREADFTRAMLARREGVLEGAGLDGSQRMFGFAPLLASADLFAVVGLPLAEAFGRSTACSGARRCSPRSRSRWPRSLPSTAARSGSAGRSLPCRTRSAG